ncbi:MAG TPA: lipid-A-disaccharide synthase N-terminal domain-containing protein, partial [Alphaproteobacteria bacterium]|nr:lipid-A-disaccharide synthase N-terminal domain-containing protein [Alphaproteobacteria bacterium]
MLSHILNWLKPHLNLLVLFGLVGQALFMMRFVAQWIVSEKTKRSVVPEVFWYFSLGGGLILLIYAVMKQDLVFILGQGTGLFIYIRNVVFI